MKIIFSFLLFLLSSIVIHAQGWETVFSYDDPIWGTGWEKGMKVKPTNDGGYLIAGEVDLPTGAVRHYMRLAKTDSTGMIQWDSTYKAGSIVDERVVFLDELPNEEIIVGGNQNSNPYLLKTNAMGETIWQNIYPLDTLQQFIDHGITCPDGGYLLVGYSRPSFNDDPNVYLLKTDSEGILQWRKTHFFPGYTVANAVDNTSDGGFILVGYVDNELTLFKIDGDGNLEWSKPYFFSGNDLGYVVKQTVDNGFLVGGSTTGINMFLPFVFKTDALGNGEWTKILTQDFGRKVTDIVLTNDGGFAAVGSANAFWDASDDGFLFKSNAIGDIEWSEIFTADNQQIAAIQVTSDGGYILGGVDEEGMLLKKIGGTITAQNDLFFSTNVEVFPNPMLHQTTFKTNVPNIITKQLQVFDSMGKLVFQKNYQNDSFVFYSKNLSKGIYFYKIKNRENVIGSGKLIIQK